MSNTIIIELCSEDRARLDRLAEALERKTCDQCVKSAAEAMNDLAQQVLALQTKVEPDPIAEAAKKALGLMDTQESPVEPQEEAKPESETTTPPETETPTVATPDQPTTEKTVDRAELRAKVIELSAKGLKEQTRDIIRAYAQTVTAVPEDKVSECYKKLVALEG